MAMNGILFFFCFFHDYKLLYLSKSDEKVTMRVCSNFLIDKMLYCNFVLEKELLIIKGNRI